MNPTCTFSWAENVTSSWQAFYTRLFADCRAKALKPWTGNPMTWAGEMYQLVKTQATDDEIISESCVDSIPFRSDDVVSTWSTGYSNTLANDHIGYTLNPEEAMCALEDLPPVEDDLDFIVEYEQFRRAQKFHSIGAIIQQHTGKVAAIGGTGLTDYASRKVA